MTSNCRTTDLRGRDHAQSRARRSGNSMRSLPVGTAYSIWVGVGAVGTVALGIVLLGEPANAARLISVALIIAGIVGLKLATPA